MSLIMSIFLGALYLTSQLVVVVIKHLVPLIYLFDFCFNPHPPNNTQAFFSV